TLAGTLFRSADADVVEVAQAEPVNDEAAAADVARDFPQRVIGGLLADADAEDAHAVESRRADQPDRALRWLALGHAWISAGVRWWRRPNGRNNPPISRWAATAEAGLSGSASRGSVPIGYDQDRRHWDSDRARVVAKPGAEERRRLPSGPRNPICVP